LEYLVSEAQIIETISDERIVFLRGGAVGNKLVDIIPEKGKLSLAALKSIQTFPSFKNPIFC